MSDQCKHSDTDRTGLYIMVFLILLQTCSIKSNVSDINDRLDSSKKEQEEINFTIEPVLKKLNELDKYAEGKGLIPPQPPKE